MNNTKKINIDSKIIENILVAAYNHIMGTDVNPSNNPHGITPEVIGGCSQSDFEALQEEVQELLGIKQGLTWQDLKDGI